ncbi:hypothetical protein [Planctellipticum variicoloris]|uniref:hypothetical protein n=1 Tax=Planctellipticum variicoloris TaxID=3064265 RepID=UPI0030133388|nr:hypothetical protein SH412_002665 [Planctomycetaceae bacterium SH412]
MRQVVTSWQLARTDDVRRYFLSRFEGTGSSLNDPYVAVVSQFGTTNIIDLRSDPTRRSGWCVASVDSADPPPIPPFAFLADLEYLYLSDDLDEELSREICERVASALNLSFCETTLRKILVELLLVYGDLRPNGDGIYRVHLAGEIWSANEEETFAVKSRYCFPYHADFTGVNPGAPNELGIDVVATLLEVVADAYGQELVNKAIANRVSSNHPIHAGLQDLIQLSQDSCSCRVGTLRSNWLSKVALDLLELRGTIAFDAKLQGRLRDARGCESLAFELAVMAAYSRNGALVTPTDENSAECTVLWNGLPRFHVECKRKEAETLRPRDSQRWFDELTRATFELMDQRSCFGSITVSSRFDPTDRDVTLIRRHLERTLSVESPHGVCTRLNSKSPATILKHFDGRSYSAAGRRWLCRRM